MRALDQAFEAFLTKDVDVAGFLALDDAELDGEEFARLQPEARRGSKKNRAKAADGLAKLVGDLRSGPALDQVLATAFDAAERWQDGLSARERALSFGGAWHPIHAGRVVGNIGHDL